MTSSLIVFLVLLALLGGSIYNLAKALLGLAPRWVPVMGFGATMGIAVLTSLVFLLAGHPDPVLGIGNLHPSILWCGPIVVMLIFIGALVISHPGALVVMLVAYLPGVLNSLNMLIDRLEGRHQEHERERGQ